MAGKNGAPNGHRPISATWLDAQTQTVQLRGRAKTRKQYLPLWEIIKSWILWVLSFFSGPVPRTYVLVVEDLEVDSYDIVPPPRHYT